MDREFKSKVALVTGAAGAGIGQATARRLAAGGATVIVTDSHERRTKEVTQAIANEYKTTVVGFVMDVTNRNQVDEVLTEVNCTYGPVQILVNNAAINILGDIFEYDPDDWDKVIAADLTGPFNTIRTVLPIMRAAGGGSIVNISSIGADRASGHGEIPYAVAKGGLNTLTRGIARVGGPHKIRCNAIALSLIEGTKFSAQWADLMSQLLADIPLGRHGSPADIAEAVAFLASDRSSYITGEILNVSGGFYMRS